METESNAAEAKILPATGRRSSPADARDGGHPERLPLPRCSPLSKTFECRISIE